MASLTRDSDESAINGPMKKSTVLGVYAARPRLTLTGLALLSTAISLPVGVTFWLIELLWL